MSTSSATAAKPMTMVITMSMATTTPTDAAADAMPVMDMSTMAMTFFDSITTPLFWRGWQPMDVGQYGATCVFLVILAVLARIMVTLKPVFEVTIWKKRRQGHPRHRSAGDVDSEHASMPYETGESEEVSPAGNAKDGPNDGYLPLLQGLRPVGMVVRSRWRGATLASRLARAIYEMLLAGIGYLL